MGRFLLSNRNDHKPNKKQKMKTMTKTNKDLKSLDLFISKISAKEILNLNEMVCIRGGEGGDVSYPIPPLPPEENENENENSLNIICN